jgi:EmrB/QacA subfamily drug resistance transporter
MAITVLAFRRDTSSATVYRRRWYILLVLCLCLLIIVLDNNILNVALPTLVRDLGASTSELQWIVDAYTLIFAGLLLAAGNLTDRFGRKQGLFIGLAIFATGSVLAAISGSATRLIFTRAVMGAGAAFIMPSTLSILTNVFPDEERGRAIGIWAATAGIGVPLGPVLGGILLEHYSWGSIFLINLPVVFATIVSAFVLIPESSDPDASPLDPIGVVLSCSGLIALVYTIIEAPNRGWGSTLTLGLFALATLLLVAFIAWELRNRHPMLNIHFFERPRFSAASLSISLVFFAMFGSFFILTQYFQFVRGYSPLEAGIRLVPAAIGIFIGAPLSSRINEHIGSKVPVAAGLALGALGLYLLSRADTGTSYGYIALAIVVFSCGMGLAMTPATDSIMGSLPRGNAGIGSAMNDTNRQVGGAMGVAVLGSLLSTHYRGALPSLDGLPPQATAARSSVGAASEIAHAIGGPAGDSLQQLANTAFVHGMQSAFLVAAGVALTSSLLALIFLPAWPQPEANEEPQAWSEERAA